MSIRNWLVALAVLLPAPLAAQGITIPNTFVNGTAADATQVNANFTSLANNALNRTGGTMTGTLTTVLVQPTVTNTSDVGTASLLYRTHYLRTSLVLGQAAGNYTVTWANPAAARAISFEDPGGTDILVYKAATQTLTNKTVTAPVLSGTVTGSYTMGGTGIWNAGAVTSTGAFSNSTFSGAGANSADIRNTSATGFGPNFAGGGSDAGHYLLNVATSGNTTKFLVSGLGDATASGKFTVTNTLAADNVASLSNASATGFGLTTAAGGSDASHYLLNLGTSGGTTKLLVSGNGDLSLGGGNVTDAVAAPTILAGNHFNTSGDSIVGKAYGFIVTTGNGAGTPFGAVSFNITFANVPVCTANANYAVGLSVAPTTTNVTISTITGANFSNGQTIHVQCRGY